MSPMIALALFAAAPDMPEGRIATVVVPADEAGPDDQQTRRWLIGDLDEGDEAREGLRVRLRGTRVKLKMPIG